MSSESDSGEEESDSDSEESVREIESLSFPTHILEKIFDKRKVVDDFKQSLKLKYNTKNQ